MLLGKDWQRGSSGEKGQAIRAGFGVYPTAGYIPIISIHITARSSRHPVHIQQIKGPIPLSLYPASHIRSLCGRLRQG